jgi:hypothetical protein
LRKVERRAFHQSSVCLTLPHGQPRPTSRESWLGLLIAGGLLLAIAAAPGTVDWIKLPRNPLAQTRRRLDDDVKQLKEHAA